MTLQLGDTVPNFTQKQPRVTLTFMTGQAIPGLSCFLTLQITRPFVPLNSAVLPNSSLNLLNGMPR